MILEKINNNLLQYVYCALEGDFPARGAFAKTCKRFHEVAKSLEVWVKLAVFIQEHYTILDSNIEKEIPLPLILKKCKILLIGESHVEDNQRKRNAEVVHLFWIAGKTDLYTERAYKLGEGQIKYINEEIARQAVCWDIDTGSLLEKLQPGEEARFYLVATQEIARFYKENNGYQFLENVQKILKDTRFTKKEIKDLQRDCERFYILLETFNKRTLGKKEASEFAFLKIAVPYCFGLLLLKNSKSVFEKIWKRISEFNAQRELSFFDHLMSSIVKERRAAGISGTRHIDPKTSLLCQKLKEAEVPFLSYAHCVRDTKTLVQESHLDDLIEVVLQMDSREIKNNDFQTYDLLARNLLLRLIKEYKARYDQAETDYNASKRPKKKQRINK